MQKVLVLGCCGAGKTVFALELGRRLGLPVTHLDALYWRPGWTPTPREEWRARVADLLDDTPRILDGNYRGTLDLRLPWADAVFDFRFPRWRCLAGALRRALRHLGTTRPDMAPGCPERIDLEFLRYIWDFDAAYRPGIDRAVAERRESLEYRAFRSPGEVAVFLAGL